MEVVNSGFEVWYSNGLGLLIINCAVLEISRRLEFYSVFLVVTLVVCSFECTGEEVVWCLDDKVNFLVMYYLVIYQLCVRYFCGDFSFFRDMFFVRLLGLEFLDSYVVSLKELEGDFIADVSIMYSEELGIQILIYQDSLIDYCFMFFYFSFLFYRVFMFFLSLFCFLVSFFSVFFFIDYEDFERLYGFIGGFDRFEYDLIFVDGEVFSQYLQVVKVFVVKDVIWVFRQVFRQGMYFCVVIGFILRVGRTEFLVIVEIYLSGVVFFILGFGGFFLVNLEGLY